MLGAGETSPSVRLSPNARTVETDKIVCGSSGTTTAIEKEHWASAPSDRTQVTVCVPTSKIEPDGGEQTAVMEPPAVSSVGGAKRHGDWLAVRRGRLHVRRAHQRRGRSSRRSYPAGGRRSAPIVAAGYGEGDRHGGQAEGPDKTLHGRGSAASTRGRIRAVPNRAGPSTQHTSSVQPEPVPPADHIRRCLPRCRRCFEIECQMGSPRSVSRWRLVTR